MRKLFFCLALLVVAGSLSAQNFRGGYFLDGYTFGYKLNPAAAGDVDYVGLQTVTSVRSNLSLKYFLFPDPDGDGLVTGLHNSVDAEAFLAPLQKKMNPAVMEEDLNLFSFGYEKNGRYHVFDASLRAGVATNVPYDTFEFLKVGTQWHSEFDMRDLFAKSHTWLELSYGQSLQLSDKVRIGARVKGLLGLSYASAHFRELSLSLQENYWRILSHSDMEFSGHGIDYKLKQQDVYNDKGEVIGKKEINEVKFGSIAIRPEKFLDINGLGATFDAGVQWVPIDGLTLSVALLDVGGIKWFDSMYARTPDLDFRSDPDRMLVDRDENAASALGDIVRFVVQDEKKNSFDWMTATVNAGARYRLPFYDKMTVGLLGMYKLDNIFQWAEIRGAVSASPLKWLSLSVNVGYNTYGMAYGAALAVNTRPVRVFIGTDAYVTEMTPQFVPLSRLNHNFQFGVAVPIYKNKRH